MMSTDTGIRDWARRAWAANRPAGPAPTIATLTGGFCVVAIKLPSPSFISTISYHRITNRQRRQRPRPRNSTRTGDATWQFAERTDAKVATASTSVPTAVASAPSVAHSATVTPAFYPRAPATPPDTSGLPTGHTRHP